jgi:hypothetical protein
MPTRKGIVQSIAAQAWDKLSLDQDSHRLVVFFMSAALGLTWGS